jgi:hypothetical protein
LEAEGQFPQAHYAFDKGAALLERRLSVVRLPPEEGNRCTVKHDYA